MKEKKRKYLKKEVKKEKQKIIWRRKYFFVKIKKVNF
jgi:hypothetical protein